MSTTHIDFAWQYPASAEEIRDDLEKALNQAIPHIGGMSDDPVDLAKYCHQKMRVTLIVEVMGDFT